MEIEGFQKAGGFEACSEAILQCKQQRISGALSDFVEITTENYTKHKV